MSDTAITFAVLAGVIVLFVANLVPVGIVAIAGGLVLYATGVLELEQVLAGFGDPTVIFIATLFVVSEGLDASGVTAWAGQRLIEGAGDSRTRLLVVTSLLVAALTALISVNGAVAALLPVVVVLAIRLKRPTSQLLMPMVFAAHAGSMLTLTGTPVNVIVSDAAEEAAAGRFGYFDFALVGLPLVAGAIVIGIAFGERLLPHRRPRSIPPDLSRHASTLQDQYQLDGDEGPILSPETGLAEVVIPPRSGLLGETVFPGMTTPSGDLVMVAVQRQGDDLGPGESVLAIGDVLLLRGTWDALHENLSDADVLAVDRPDVVRRQAVPLGFRAKEAIAIVSAMVIVLATGAVPPAVAGLLAAGALVVLGVLSAEGAYRGINWTTVVLVGAMIPLSTAMTETSAAADLADALVAVVGNLGPYALLVGLFLLTAILGQLISNMATALIVTPIAVSAAGELGVSVKPVLMSLTVAAAAAFLTPVATPVNMMVKGPGGYVFGDYWKFGLPFLLLFAVVAVLLVPVFWSF